MFHLQVLVRFLGLELLPREPYLDWAGPDGVTSGHRARYKCFPHPFGLTCVPLKQMPVRAEAGGATPAFLPVHCAGLLMAAQKSTVLNPLRKTDPEG